MTPERRQRIEQIYRVALERDAQRRASFLDTACAGDRELRRQVEALLAVNQSNPLSFETAVGEEDKETTEREPSLIDRRIGHYRIISSLGVGGMGEVWLAEDLLLGRQAAIKILPARLTENVNRVRRFELEARAASALNHPNIVTIYEFGEAELGRFIVMEMVGGRTLREVIDAAPRLNDAIEIGAQIARALSVAHDAGIIHRDIKPENIMVRGDGLVKLLDFGIARLTPAGQESSGVRTTARTGTGKLLGTVQYMSPEQARSEPVTSATDLFSLGIVLYELFTGKHPFEADTQTSVQLAIITQPALPPSHINPEISPELDALILQMLEKEPHLRPEAWEVERELEGERDGVKEGTSERGKDPNPFFSPSFSPSLSPSLHIVGREKERAELRAGFTSTLSNRGLLMCVAGEPGLGKTTLVEQFLRELRERGAGCRIARGRCSERLAGTEAYLPWLEALDNLVRSSESAARSMKQLAPNWYAQLAPGPSAQTETSRGDALAASQERLKRELSGFLRETSRREPLVLSFDDLHWADVSTIDLLGFIANRFEGTRLLIVVTYRPSELQLVKHPFLQIKPDLQAHGVCRELTLEFLNQVEIENYLELEFPLHRFPPEFPQLIHAKTEGNPLFMADLVRYLRDQKVIVEENGEWRLGRTVPEIERELPESVRGMIERKIAQLSDQDRQLLVAASVQGAQFDSAVSARVIGLDEIEVEDRLDALERAYAFVQLIGERELPDRTLTLRYRFVHVFYQNALFGSLRATRKVQLSRAVAQALIDCYGERSREVASELALLWLTARDYAKSAESYRIAANNAVQVFASQEAATLARRGLAALEPLAESKEKDEQELLLQITLGNILIATRGYASAEVEQVYSRARRLCERLEDEAHLPPVLYGLYVNHMARARHRQALNFGEEFLNLAQRRQDPTVIVGYRAVGVPLFFMGRLAEAREMFAAGLAGYDPAQHRSLTWTYGAEPGAVLHLYQGWALWLMGYPDQALAHSREAARLAREVAHAQTQAQALSGSALLHQYRREPQPARELAEAAIKFSAEQGLALWLSWGTVLSGWAMIELGEHQEGIARLRRGLDASVSTGSGMWQTYLKCLLADVLIKIQRLDESLAILDALPEAIETSGERFWEAEIYRIRGEALKSKGAAAEGCEQCFLQAFDLARRQGARLLELRAAISLANLHPDAAARQRLSETYACFTEGFETSDLMEAKKMLNQNKKL